MPGEPQVPALAGMRVDASTPAVVLDVHDHNGLAQVRTLGRLGVEVSITHAPRPSAATRSRYVARRFPFDLRTQSHGAAVEHLLAVVAPALGRRAVLLASGDEAAILLGEHAAALAERFLVPAPPPGLVRRLVDKAGLHELCEQTGTPAPRTAIPASVEDAEAFLDTATYPLVVKARDAWRIRHQSNKVTFVVDNRDEASHALRRLAFGDQLNVVLQEYLPGGVDTVWTYHAYANAEAEPVFALVGNKLRDYPVDSGLTTLGVNLPNAVVHDAASAFVRAVGYRGIIDLDFRLDPRDGRYKALDFNPRPGANFRLFADDAGVDVVRAAYLDLTGQPIPAGRQRVGRRWVVEHWDVAGARRRVAAGQLGPRGYLRSLRGVEEAAWWARDDPMPFVAMSAAFAGIAARKVLGRHPA